ncbi:MAG: hypothetical protein F2563_03560 [Actinobacteria bacterium]|uniref:Unannotated protein n=1 Tax=freshwater metagenome TaxID=449393 RepID=A0A6J6EZ43_9ZZZZ|nr:hypothetical protein [Actinomycetota bacterium]
MTHPEKTSKILRLLADGLSIETVALMVGVSERFVKHVQSNSKHMKKHITITTQGIKGGNTKTQNVGYAIIELRHDQDRITVDDFQGSGQTYRKRELQKIEVIQNGEVLFEGNKYELFEILKAAKATQP